MPRPRKSDKPRRLPELPIRVEEVEDPLPTQRKPLSIKLGSRWETVVTIHKIWEEKGFTEAIPVSKTFYQVTLGGGVAVVIFRNHHTGGWYLNDPLEDEARWLSG